MVTHHDLQRTVARLNGGPHPLAMAPNFTLVTRQHASQPVAIDRLVNADCQGQGFTGIVLQPGHRRQSMDQALQGVQIQHREMDALELTRLGFVGPQV